MKTRWWVTIFSFCKQQVGHLEDNAAKRKERLAALKRKLAGEVNIVIKLNFVLNISSKVIISVDIVKSNRTIMAIEAALFSVIFLTCTFGDSLWSGLLGGWG